MLWTVASRVAGLVRLAISAAVLGPTFLGNVFLTTNTIPNLVYGLLGGALIAGLVVPALVGHIDAGRTERATEIAGDFLAVLLAAAAALMLALVATAAFTSRVLTAGVPSAIGGDARRATFVLLVLVAPQVVGYAVTGVAAAVQNAHGRYGLAAGGFVVENIGVSVGLVLVASRSGSGHEVGDVSTATLVALGLVGTVPVAVHAIVQWCAAARLGVRLSLRPRIGRARRDPEVRHLVRLAVPSMAVAGLFSARLLAAAVVAGSIAGGWVALQIAFAFANMPSGLVGRPLGATLLRPVSRALVDGDGPAVIREYRRAAALGIMVALPAAVGMVTLAVPLADLLAVGSMGAAVTLVVWSLVSLAPGVVGDTLFEISKAVPLAARDSRQVLTPTVVRAGISIAGLASAYAFSGVGRLAAVGVALSAGDLAGAWHLHRRALRAGDRRRPATAGSSVAGLGLAHSIPAAAVMALVTVGALAGVRAVLGHGVAAGHGPTVHAVIGVGIGGALGLAAYAAHHWWVASSELAGWIGRPVGRRRGAPRPERRVDSRSATTTTAAIGAVVAMGVLLVVAVPLAVGTAGLALVAAAVVALSMLVATAVRPAIGAWVYLGAMPILAGIDRGRFFPLLRPTEALQLLVTAGALIAAGWRALRTALPAPRLTRLDASLVAMALCGSAVPIARLLLAGRQPTGGDLLGCLPLWKYAALYLLFRSTIRSRSDLDVACGVSIAVASLVAGIAVCQTLDLAGVRQFLATLWVPYGEVGDLSEGRGTATFGGAIATSAYLTCNIGLSVALVLRAAGRRRLLLGAASIALLVGVMGTAQFSGMLGVIVVVVVVSAASGKLRRLLAVGLVMAPLAALVVAPALAMRGRDTGSSGIPVSWVVRFYNLRTYYWPQLADYRWLFGARPDTVVAAPERWRDVIYVESGHTWLLLVGGVPLLVAFCAFVVIAARSLREAARIDDTTWGPVARAALAVVITLFVLMILDTHLTMRGGADMIFALMGMALARYGARSLPWPEARRRIVRPIAVAS